MDPVVKKFDNNIYQIDVLMEDKKERMACYYIDSQEPILIEVGPSNSFPYLIAGLESIGIKDIRRSAITHLHLDHVGGIGHMVEEYKDHFVYIHELGEKHLPNPEKLWKAVADVYTEEWLENNWGKIKPTPLENIKTLNDGYEFKLSKTRLLKALYSPGHAKHHYTFYDEESGTMFMGDTLGLIYPHGEFVQPNLPPPDFDKELLYKTLDNIRNYAYESIDNWINFITSLPDTSDEEAASLLTTWVRTNYEILLVDNITIENYIKNMNPLMQIKGIRNYLNLID